jgi:hypothetical protein
MSQSSQSHFTSLTLLSSGVANKLKCLASCKQNKSKAEVFGELCGIHNQIHNNLKPPGVGGQEVGCATASVQLAS